MECCEAALCLSVALSNQGQVSSMEESVASVNVRALQVGNINLLAFNLAFLLNYSYAFEDTFYYSK